MDEADLLIDANGSRVVLERGQERHAARSVNVARDRGDKSLGIATAAEVRVSADGTDFRKTGWGQSLAGHGGEPAADANSQVPSELSGMVAEGPRLGERSEGQHLGIIRRLHGHDGLRERGLSWNRRADHLNESAATDKLPSRRNRGLILKKKNRNIAFGHDGGEVCICLGGGFLKCRERSYIGRVAAGETMSYLRPDGETGMRRSQGIPDGIIEQRVIADL